MKFVTILTAVLLTQQLNAQSITGTITDAESRAPVPGVLLTVRDSARAIRTRVLTDQNGSFRVPVTAGEYHVTAEHIAFTPMTRAVRVGGQAFQLTWALTPAAIALAEIVVRTERQCQSAEDPGAARLWYVARTALGAASAETTKEFRLRHFRRVLDLSFNQVGNDSMRFEIQRGSHSYRSIPTDSLLRHGFVQDHYGMLAFFGPDAELLLSDAFVNSHCFQVERSKEKPGLIGLAFWPHKNQRRPDIEGAMWVDQKTGLLQYVEYQFTGLPQVADKRFASGRVEFEMLPDRSWMVRRWYIRMPHFVNAPGVGRVRSVLGGSVEEGGEVLSLNANGTSGGAIGTIIGVVYDSIKKRPLADAAVYLSGTRYATATDANGAFLLDSVPPGDHYVTFHATPMSVLPRFNNTLRVRVQPDSVSQISLAIPSERTLMAAHCTTDDLFEASRSVQYGANRIGVLTGVVRSGGRAVAGARVTVTWGPRSAWTETRSDGDYALCGYPADTGFTVIVNVKGEERLRRYYEPLDTRLRRIEIDLPRL